MGLNPSAAFEALALACLSLIGRQPHQKPSGISSESKFPLHLPYKMGYNSPPDISYILSGILSLESVMTDPQSSQDNIRSRNPWPDSVYQDLREKLILFFRMRDLCPPDEYAHDVIERLLIKLNRIFTEGLKEKERKYQGLVRIYELYTSGMNLAEDELSIKDLRMYAYGIAKKVCLEGHKKRQHESLSEEDEEGSHYQLIEPGSENEAAIHAYIFPAEVLSVSEECLLDCLQNQPQDKKEMLLKYYETDKKKDPQYHKRLAVDLMMQPGALDTAVCRARGKLRICLCLCIERKLPDRRELWCKDRAALGI